MSRRSYCMANSRMNLSKEGRPQQKGGEVICLRQPDHRVIPKNHLLRKKIANGDEQPFVAVDAELDLETRLSCSGGRFGVQKSRVLFVDPEIIATFFLVGRHVADPGGAAGIKDQFHRLGAAALPAFAQLEN